MPARQDRRTLFTNPDDWPDRYLKADQAFADFWNVSLSSIKQNWLKMDNNPGKDPEKGYDLWAWAKFFRERAAMFAQQKSSAVGSSPRSLAQTRKLEVDTKRSEFKLAAEMNELVHVDDLRPVIADMVSHIKSQHNRMVTLILRQIPQDQQATVQRTLKDVISGIDRRIAGGFIGPHNIEDLAQEGERLKKGREKVKKATKKKTRRKKQ